MSYVATWVQEGRGSWLGVTVEGDTWHAVQIGSRWRLMSGGTTVGRWFPSFGDAKAWLAAELAAAA